MASPITCHVLNTLSGTPAADLKATLTFLPVPSQSSKLDLASFTATTDADGRVKLWQGQNLTLEQTMDQFKDGERVAWSIKFEIGPWYEALGIESFWPEIEVKFYVKKGSDTTMYLFLWGRGLIRRIVAHERSSPISVADSKEAQWEAPSSSPSSERVTFKLRGKFIPSLCSFVAYGCIKAHREGLLE